MKKFKPVAMLVFLLASTITASAQNNFTEQDSNVYDTGYRRVVETEKFRNDSLIMGQVVKDSFSAVPTYKKDPIEKYFVSILSPIGKLARKYEIKNTAGFLNNQVNPEIFKYDNMSHLGAFVIRPDEFYLDDDSSIYYDQAGIRLCIIKNGIPNQDTFVKVFNGSVLKHGDTFHNNNKILFSVSIVGNKVVLVSQGEIYQIDTNIDTHLPIYLRRTRLSISDSVCVSFIDTGYNVVSKYYDKSYAGTSTIFTTKDYGRGEFYDNYIYFINYDSLNFSKLNTVTGKIEKGIHIPDLMPKIFLVDKFSQKIFLVKKYYDSIQMIGMKVLIVDTALNLLDSISLYDKYTDTIGLFPEEIVFDGIKVYVAGFSFKYDHSEIISESDLVNRQAVGSFLIKNLLTGDIKKQTQFPFSANVHKSFVDITPVGLTDILAFSSTYGYEFEFELPGGYNTNFQPENISSRYFVPYVPLYLDPDSVIIKKKKEIFSKNFVIYPNPTNGKIYFDIKDDGELENPGTAYIYSLSGKVILKQDLRFGKNDFNLSDLTPGMYIVVVSNEIETKSFKLIKN